MVQDRLSIAATIAQELKVKPTQIEAAIQLLDEGATVPFIARYRKEKTAGLDDTHLRLLAERLCYLRELDERRAVVLQTIREQGQLTPELEQAIQNADTKTRLEDLYLPYRPKRRTKAQMAKEAGLLPLAQALLTEQILVPEAFATQFINPEVSIDNIELALDGARQILMEQFAEEADLLNELRHYLWEHAVLTAQSGKAKKSKDNKFADYENYAELLKKIPSHRALALFRGRRESALQLTLTLPENPQYGEQCIVRYFKIKETASATSTWLMETVRLAWKLKLFVKLELELLARLREIADEEAIRVFSRNLSDLLLAAPAGPRVTMGLDPGIRTGVKVAVVDNYGKLLDYTTVFPLAPQNEWHPAIATLAKLAAKYQVDLISIGNGTGSRETERLVTELIRMYPDLNLKKVLVSEAGASVYSASELAAKEFPDLDVSLRGAVSIARRIQDPLAELVKIEPKSIGVGQYQHDVNPTRLARCLDGVVEDCVNAVGVNVNTASAALLTRVCGFNEALAKNVVSYREEHGAFPTRDALKNVPRMGEKAFQQAAGFLRINNGPNPLDRSGVHPEAYPVVERMLADQQLEIQQIIGNVKLLQQINAQQYVDEQYGLPTVRDILQELEKPGRDPRPEFKTVNFKEGVETIADLKVGMIMEGVVSNVTNFGVFVDIGVHQDGLVHISAMTTRFITDPHTLAKAGDVITVKVLEIDEPRRRISLTMKLEEDKAQAMPKKAMAPVNKKPKLIKKTIPVKKAASTSKGVIFNTAMADALAKLKRGTE